MTDVVELLRAEIERLREDVAEWQQAASVEAGLRRKFSDQCATIRAATIEECAQMADEFACGACGMRGSTEIAAAIRALKEQQDAAIVEYAKPLEQIRQVCADNAGKRSNHKMALDFVHQIAIRALKEKHNGNA